MVIIDFVGPVKFFFNIFRLNELFLYQ